MTENERKLKDLRGVKNKQLVPTGNKSSELKLMLNNVESAFHNFIKSDNIASNSERFQELRVSIEGHSDFTTAVSYLNRAIQEVESEIKNDESNSRGGF